MSDFFSFQGLSGGYGDTLVLENISGHIAQGAGLGILGRNGVGKSTLARLLYGLLSLHSGSVYLRGQDISALKPWERYNLGLGFMPQTEMVYDDLNVRENFLLTCHEARLEQCLNNFPYLRARQTQKAGAMSGGERKILGFSRIMAEDNVLVILDEPTEGVQQENISIMGQMILSARENGVGFVVIEQNISFLETVCDYVLALDSQGCRFFEPLASISRAQMIDTLRV